MANNYITEDVVLEEFFKTKCFFGDDLGVPMQTLFTRLNEWLFLNYNFKIALKKFRILLHGKGLKTYRSNNIPVVEGIGLLEWD